MSCLCPEDEQNTQKESKLSKKNYQICTGGTITRYAGTFLVETLAKLRIVWSSIRLQEILSLLEASVLPGSP